jgi:hypothetical protein
MTQGFKVMKSGKSITSNLVKDMILDSEHQFFKYNSDNIYTLNINAGDTSRTAEFSHGLSDPPAYKAFMSYGGLIRPCPYWAQAISGINNYFYTYVTSSNIGLGFYSPNPWGQDYFSESDYYHYLENGGWGDNTFFMVGNNSDLLGQVSGALRFKDVSLAKNTIVNQAYLNIYVVAKGSGTGDLYLKCYGINEGNTSDFGGDPMGRPQTTSVTTAHYSIPSTGQNVSVNVTNQVNEILARSDWVSGNHMGFLFYDNGSNNNVFVEGGASDTLQITSGTGTSIDFRVVTFKDKLI